MRYLLDTHILLWMRQNDPRLPREKWEPIFFSGDHEILFSLVSIWEISIKQRIGKLQIEASTEDFVRALIDINGFSQIQIELHEICRTERLPDHHRDPFDRLLIAQAMEANAIAVTDDRRWHDYPIQIDF